MCPFLDNNTTVTGPSGRFTVRKSFSCQLTNVIYVIRCLRCANANVLYIGETGRSIETRAKEHIADIRHHRGTTVAEHFVKNAHSLQDFRIQVIWLVKRNNTLDRKFCESRFITKLGTYTPAGLNRKV